LIAELPILNKAYSDEADFKKRLDFMPALGNKDESCAIPSSLYESKG